MIKLDKRLRAVLDEVDCHTLLDIGCDHGKISVCAVLEKRAERVLAVDISKASLEKTTQLCQKFLVSHLVETILSDGFKNVDKPYDQVVIAGMGGHEMIKILSASCFSKRIILLPHQDAHLLRAFICGKFGIIKDITIESSGKFYPLIVLKEGKDSYKEDELSYGFFQPDNIDYVHMIAIERLKQQRIAKASNNYKKYDEVIKLCSKLGI